MEKGKPRKVDFEKFRTGCISIFKCWTAFRMTLDQNPQILRYITDNNTIEINDILTTIKSNKSGIKELTDNVADCLNYFVGDYFRVQLADDSDLDVAKDLIKLYDELKYGKETFLNELKAKADKDNKQKYWIDFPITGKQVLQPKKKEESESDEEGEEEEAQKDDKLEALSSIVNSGEFNSDKDKITEVLDDRISKLKDSLDNARTISTENYFSNITNNDYYRNKKRIEDISEIYSMYYNKIKDELDKLQKGQKNAEPFIY